MRDSRQISIRRDIMVSLSHPGILRADHGENRIIVLKLAHP